MTVITVGVLKETADGERRVALDPEAVARLVKDGRSVTIEPGAGLTASFPDASYVSAGATLGSRADILNRSDVLAVVRCPNDAVADALRPGQVLIGLVDPLNNLELMGRLAANGVTVAAFELLPRTLSRAQSMDAMTSQSSAAGYRAAIVGAEAFGRYFPMMITASGTARPASVIVLGAGVAGLQAIGTAKRLGAVVTGYDVRPASRGEVESLGAQFLTSSVAEGAGAGGYARATTAEELDRQQAELSEQLKNFDVIITTAKVPGRTPPLLVSAETLATLAPGSVCVDLGASDRGGNVAGSVNGSRIVTERGVIVIGAGDLASDLATSASQMYGRNISALIGSLAASLIDGGAISIDPTDEVHSSVIVCNAGSVTSPIVREAMGLEPLLPEASGASSEESVEVLPA